MTLQMRLSSKRIIFQILKTQHKFISHKFYTFKIFDHIKKMEETSKTTVYLIVMVTFLILHYYNIKLATTYESQSLYKEPIVPVILSNTAQCRASNSVYYVAEATQDTKLYHGNHTLTTNTTLQTDAYITSNNSFVIEVYPFGSTWGFYEYLFKSQEIACLSSLCLWSMCGVRVRTQFTYCPVYTGILTIDTSKTQKRFIIPTPHEHILTPFDHSPLVIKNSKRIWDANNSTELKAQIILPNGHKLYHDGGPICVSDYCNDFTCTIQIQ